MAIKVFSVAEMVAAEKAADAAGVSYAQMMETAGRRVAEAIHERYEVAEAKALVLVGPGNNGGDGLVAGRYLAEAGADVAFYLSKARDAQTDENFARIQAMGLFAVEAGFDQRFRVLRTRLNVTDLLIDALLGTGVSHPVTGDLAKLMRQVQAGLEERRAALAGTQQSPLVRLGSARKWKVEGGRWKVESTGHSLTPSLPHPLTPSPFIVAVDCPSGMNSDTGALDAAAVGAQLTVTFAGPKRGHFRFPGAAACGEIVVADIGIPADLPEVQSVALELATAERARDLLPARPPDGHKGTFGTALIAAGSGHYWGAPALSARAAYRAGAGLVALAVPGVIRPVVAGQLPEATYPPVSDQDTFSAQGAREVLEAASAVRALLVGPGLGEAGEFMAALLDAGRGSEATAWIKELAQRQDARLLPPLVVDADGLNLLAQMADWPQRLPANCVLTPHPGEMARLMGIELQDLKEMDRVGTAQARAAAWGHVVLLKGAFTVVAAPDGRCTLLPFANPALGSAGSGDVLAGIIVALLAQGLEPYEAAVLAGYLHGAAVQIYPGDRGLLAGEMADLVPAVFQSLL